MKSLIFPFIFIFAQIGVCQVYLNQKLTDTIIIDKKFIKKLDHEYNEQKKVLYISPTNFEINYSQFYKIKGMNNMNVNIIFYNKTKRLIFIENIKGGSNYLININSLTLPPHKQASIKMTLGVSNETCKTNRILRFGIKIPKKKKKRVCKRHIFNFVRN